MYTVEATQEKMFSIGNDIKQIFSNVTEKFLIS